jgi:predicted ATPase
MKIVLCGGPCCGKSTIISELKSRGFNVMEEAAREVIKKTGIITDEVKFQKDIYDIQTHHEKRMDESEELFFLDRGIMDGHAYSIKNINRIPEDISIINTKRYALVLILDRFPLFKDGERREQNEEEAEIIHNLIHKCYIDSGYNPIRIPIMEIEKRADYILEIVNQHRNKN